MRDRSLPAPTAASTCLVISCEHGGREVPTAYSSFFADHGGLLDSHRGWDPGALELAREMAAAFEAPLFYSTTTRLLIDLNRSIGHRQLFSEATRVLTKNERLEVARQHYRPHRDAVEADIARRIAAGGRVVHIASHSFTPVFGGVERRADVAWLYDARRSGEATFSRRWRQALAALQPGLHLRLNYPYRGHGDGLTSLLRSRFPGEAYVGIELEVNQKFVADGGAAWQKLRADVIAALGTVLSQTPVQAG